MGGTAAGTAEAARQWCAAAEAAVAGARLQHAEAVGRGAGQRGMGGGASAQQVQVTTYFTYSTDFA